MKEKRRSNEKRKEKSRDAARSRRSRETDIFTELAQALPCPQACPCPTIEAQHLDKASVMRLAIAYLKTRTLVQAAVPKTLAKPEITPDPEEHLLKALDGFVLVLDNNGDMVYLTPNVKDFLGIAQMDLMGQSIYDYSHPCDHDEIRESFAVKSVDAEQERLCNFFLRLKCTLTSKGRKVNLKSASYKVLHCTGRIIAHTNEQNNLPTDSNNQEETQKKEPSVSLVVVASPVPHPSNIEIPLGKYTFLSKHNLNMKFTYADDKLADFLGWESKELMGQSVFDFHHALDNASLDKSFKSLFSKGQCETMAYRFLNKRGGYAWVVTQATLIHCSRLQKPLSVVCVNYLLSGVEHEDEVYSVRQLEARASNNIRPALREQPSSALQDKPVAVTASLFRSTAVPPQQPRVVVQVEEDKENDQPPLLLVNKKATNPELSSNNFDFLNSDLFAGLAAQGERPPGGPAAPESATASIFAPRTKEMNKGFLTFSEDQPGLTMLKDEPDDLTHLAPTAGDVCVPLEEPPFLSDMLDEFILGNGSDSYCSSSTPNDDGSVATSDLVLDPFICRRGPELESETEPELDSPKSSDTQLLQQDDGKQLSEDEMLMMSISDVMADDELALRAPYIPMSDQDEALQLLISDDVLMWPSQPGLLLTASPDEKKWSSEPPDDCIVASKPTNSNNSNSSLAQLLSNDYEHLKDRRGTPLDNSIRVDNNSTSSNHHNNKRPNAGTSHKSSHESLSKRLKHSDTQRPVSQLLQQLQQQSEHRPLGLHQDDGGGRMDTSTTNPAATTKTGQPPHSSSVLMNLLVSGCDMQAIQEELQRSGSSSPMAGLTLQQQPQQQNKISELQVRMEEQLQRVPQWTNNLNSDSVSSMSNSCSPISKQQLQTNFEPLSYDDELSFISSADMLRDNDELFSVLDSTLL